MRVFADIGELGWALYLSAYVRWLNLQSIETEVVTDRSCLFENSRITSVPKEFYDKFGSYPADGFGRYGVGDSYIRDFFPNLADDFKYDCDTSILDKTIYKPYIAESEPYKGSIIVFPRCRVDEHHKIRNLPKEFYEKLIEELCLNFKDRYILTLGAKDGAYDIKNKFENYKNLVGVTDMQGLIDFCSSAKVAIGGTSAPPKIALLQRTPTFIIGHEKERFTEKENWSKTKVGFWKIGVGDYNNFDSKECLSKIIEFVKDVS